MYLMIKEIVEYVNFLEDYIKSLVFEGKIRVVYDGK